MSDTTEYSDRFAGDKRNHNLPVRFDMTTGGYLGITQWDSDSTKVRDRVLLSPEQVEHLMVWVAAQAVGAQRDMEAAR